MKTNNCNSLAPARCTFKDYPDLSVKDNLLAECNSVNACGPEHLRASQTCYRLTLPSARIQTVPLRSWETNTNVFAHLFSRLRSRSLTELTRQITPPTKNGHAPPPIESRKICNLSILTMSDLVSFPVLGQIKPQIPRLVVPFRQFL